MNALTHYSRLARDAAAYQAAERKRLAEKALDARLDKLSPVTTHIEGIEVVCYIDADDNCEAVLHQGVDISALLELASCAGDRWWRVVDDHIDTAINGVEA